MVLPALVTSLVASAVSWIGLPDAPTYLVPAYPSSPSIVVWAILAGPIAGVVSVGFIRLIAFADRSKPKGWVRVVAPAITLGALGAVSIAFPQVLGNGKDVSQLAFVGGVAPLVLLALLVLKPAATAACLGSGTPGGLFTPSLALGALLGGLLGQGWSLVWPGAPPGLFAICGAGAVLAATTQGPISAAVLIIELTGHDRSFILPLLVAIATATLVSRTFELRSIYDARLSPEQVQKRRQGVAAPS
jgi:H+/Cl- antiporter ClcA